MDKEPGLSFVGLFGLPPPARKAFDLLVKQGTLTATETATALGRSRSRAYEVLRQLVSLGLAVEAPGRPVRFHVRPAREALSTLKQELEAQAALLEDALTNLPPAGDVDAPASAPAVTIFHGWESAEREAARIVRAASGQATILDGRSPARLVNSKAMRGAVAKAVRKGVHVTLFGAPEIAQGKTRWPPESTPKGVQAYLVQGLSPFSCVINDDVALYLLPHGGAAAPLALRIVSPGLARFTRRTLDRLAGELARSGLPLADADEFTAAYAAALSAAKHDVAIIAGRGWPRLVKHHHFRVIQGHAEGAATRGVRLRALMHDDPENHAFLQRFGRHELDLRTASWIPEWTAVIDGAQMFQALLDPAGPVIYRWTRDPGEVRFHLARFEQTWTHSRPLDRPTRPRTTRPRPNAKDSQ